MTAQNSLSMEVSEACPIPMQGGDSLHSYAKNSASQKKVIDISKEVMQETIAEELDISAFHSTKTFGVADLGCSVGSNTFTAVENIIESVKSKYQSQGLPPSQIPEFHVSFNDHASNDFNLLFTSLPQNKQYYAAGVPGSFYNRIVPQASLHFVHSSCALHWLSRVPKEVMDRNSPAWNKGQIVYAYSGDEVIQAYKAQHEEDMEKFLQARALEVVHGGLLLLTIPFTPNGTHPSQITITASFGLIGSSLMDLVRKGRVSEEKVDSFNLPLYFMSAQEVEAAVERNGCFSIVRMETLPPVFGFDAGKEHLLVGIMRAATEGIIKEHFGEDIVDELFDLYHKKVVEIYIPFAKSAVEGLLFVALKRKS